MLKKLFKYDMKWILKFMIPFMIITVISSILNRMFFELRDISFIFNILYFTTVVITNGLVINLVFNTIIRNIIRFKSQVYGDESYLVHTLPVKRNDIVISKILSSVVSLLIAIIVSVLCIGMEYLTPQIFDILKTFLNTVSLSYGINQTVLIIGLIVYVVLSTIWLTEMLYTSIILGYRSNDKKLLKSFIYAVVLYIIVELGNLIGIGVLAIFNSSIFDLLKTNEMVGSIVKPLIIMLFVLSVIYSVVFFITSTKFINKKLNVD